MSEQEKQLLEGWMAELEYWGDRTLIALAGGNGVVAAKLYIVKYGFSFSLHFFGLNIDVTINA